MRRLLTGLAVGFLLAGSLATADVWPNAYYLVRDEGTDLVRRMKLNFVGAGVSCADDSSNGETDCTISGGGSGYATIDDEGTPLTQQATLNFTGAGVTCTNDGGGSETDCDIPGGSGSPGGNNKEVQYNNSSAFGGMANLETDGTHPDYVSVTSEVTAPAAGNVRQYAHAPSNFSFPVPHFKGPNERHWSVVPSIGWDWTIMCWVPSVTTTFAGVGTASSTNSGTLSHPALATTSLITTMKRGTFTSASTAGASAGPRAALDEVWRGSSGTLGGFFFYARWGSTTAVAQQRAAVGLADQTTAFANANPSALLDVVYIGYDSAQTTLRACGNDNSGTATCTDLGASFPVNSTAVYDVWIYAPPNGTRIDWYVERLDSAAAASGSITASADLPRNTIMLGRQLWINNGTTASAAIMEVARSCVATQW